jgi:hypothetical protein
MGQGHGWWPLDVLCELDGAGFLLEVLLCDGLNSGDRRLARHSLEDGGLFGEMDHAEVAEERVTVLLVKQILHQRLHLRRREVVVWEVGGVDDRGVNVVEELSGGGNLLNLC